MSVVIPVYNGANFLRDAIASALAQTWPEVEVIVVDDGSDDKGATIRVAESFGDRIRLISIEHGGVSAALNAGIGVMSGDLFAWLSHDDVYHPDKLRRQIAALDGHEDDAIAYSDYELVGPDLGRIKQKILPDVPPAGFRLWLMAESALHGCTVLVPRSCFDGELFDERLATTQDYDMWFRLARDHRFVRVPEVLLKYRIHGRQESWLNPNRVEEGNRLLLGFLAEMDPATIRAATDEAPSIVYLRAAIRFKLRGFLRAAAAARELAALVQDSDARRLVPRRLILFTAYHLANPHLRPMYWWKWLHFRTGRTSGVHDPSPAQSSPASVPDRAADP